jgi:hypothetical protein
LDRERMPRDREQTLATPGRGPRSSGANSKVVMDGSIPNQMRVDRTAMKAHSDRAGSIRTVTIAGADRTQWRRCAWL